MRIHRKFLTKAAFFFAVAVIIYFSFSSNSEMPCEPRGNIVFLKTHKTAGTTVQNIFFRYADSHQRVVAIPHLEQHLGEIQRFRPSLVFPLKPPHQNHIFAHHAIFDYEEMRAAMPDDAFYVTVLREPAAQFESAYAYFNFHPLYRMNIKELTSLSASHPHWKQVKDGRKRERYGRNQQAFDLGIDPSLFDDEDAIADQVRELDRQFHLVLITELLDESLILLKTKLCWKELSDVIAFKNYARSSAFKKTLSSQQMETAREMNRADTILYEHFYRKLTRQIDEFGREKMAEEVEKLRRLRQEMSDFCLAEEEEIDPVTHKVKKFVGFKLMPEVEENKTCQDLIKGDWPYTLILLNKQKKLYEQSQVEVAVFDQVIRSKLVKPTPPK